MFSFFRRISGVVSEYINCRLVIVLDNQRLVSEKILKLSSSCEPMSNSDERQKYGCGKRSSILIL